MKTIAENQKGMALISVLLILFSLTVIGIVAVNSANIETLITTNNKVSKQAFFLAEAGSQEAKETLRKRIMDRSQYPGRSNQPGPGSGRHSGNGR